MQKNCSARRYQLSCLETAPAIYQSGAVALCGPVMKVYFTSEPGFIFSLIFNDVS